MDLINYLVLFTFIINIVFALIIRRRLNKTPAHFIFELTIYAISAWCLSMLFFRMADNSTGFFLAKLLYFFPTFIPTGFLLFGLMFPRNTINKDVLYIIAFLNLIMAFLTLNDKTIIENVIVVPGKEPIIIFGLGYYLLYIWYIPGFFIASYVVLLKKYLHAETRSFKNQIIYILLGLSAASTPALITNLVLPTIGYFEFNWIGQICTFIWVGLVTYSIKKHRFIDFHTVVLKSIIYTTLFVLLALMYSGGLFIISGTFTHEKINPTQLIFSIFLTLIVALTIQPLEKFLSRVTNNIFHKRVYDSNDLLRVLGRIMASTYQLNDLSQLILHTLVTKMHVSSGVIVLVKEGKIFWAKAHNNEHLHTYNEKKINTLIEYSENTNERILLLDDIENTQIKEIMVGYSINIVVSLKVEKHIIGALLLKAKLSGDNYSLDDIKILEILGPEISLAIQNALAYEEIRKFNETLQGEVEKATQEIKDVTTQMYTKNLELAERNKTLSLLRKIDEIVLSSVTDTQKIAEKVGDIVVEELHFKAVLIGLVNKETDTIVEISTSPKSVITSLEKAFNKQLSGATIPLKNPKSLIAKTVRNKKMYECDNVYEVYHPIFTKEESILVNKQLDIKSHLVFPLIVRNEVLGVIVMGASDAFADMSEYRRDVINRLVGVIGIAIDNALLYEKIKEANRTLKELDKLKDDFVSVASHELRTPMTAIRSYLWLAMSEKGGKLSEKNKFYLERSYNSTVRLIKLVNDMLNVSRIESGRMNFEMLEVDMNKLVEDTVSEVKPRADELGVNLIIKKDPKLPHVIADVDKIKEVVINFIGNSLKFTPKKGSITVSFEVKDNKVVTHVTDTGKGLDAEDIPKLFQKFGLVKGSYETNQNATQGTGLGLYICKSIIDAHKGTVWAASEGKEKGATFSFTLEKFTKKEAGQLNKELKGTEGIGIIHTEI